MGGEGQQDVHEGGKEAGGGGEELQGADKGRALCFRIWIITVFGNFESQKLQRILPD